MKKIYKEWFSCNCEKEVNSKWKELAKKYNKSDIYVARYKGIDNKFHREIFIF